MVHALQKIHSLLETSKGCLIDIHPRAIPRPLCVRVDQREYLIQALIDETRFMTYQQADNALLEVVNDKRYNLEVTHPFSFYVYFDTLAEFTQYLLQNDTGSDRAPCVSVDPHLIQRIEEHLQLPGDTKQIVLQRPVTIRRYQPISLV